MHIELVINGQHYSYPDPLTGAELLRQLEIPPATVVVELNGEIVKREQFLGLTLKSGDALELVTIVGGG